MGLEGDCPRGCGECSPIPHEGGYGKCECECHDRPKAAPTLWVHGMQARSLEQVAAYLTGDAHDRSKVQVFDGERFYDVRVNR